MDGIRQLVDYKGDPRKFLELNGYRFTASEEAATLAVLELATGTLDDTGYTAFLRANAQAERTAKGNKTDNAP